MKRQWQVHRQFQAAAEGERRWDQAYQQLLKWDFRSERPAVPLLRPPSLPSLEVTHENGYLCTRIDRAPDPGTDH